MKVKQEVSVSLAEGLVAELKAAYPTVPFSNLVEEALLGSCRYRQVREALKKVKLVREYEIAFPAMARDRLMDEVKRGLKTEEGAEREWVGILKESLERFPSSAKPYLGKKLFFGGDVNAEK